MSLKPTQEEEMYSIESLPSHYKLENLNFLGNSTSTKHVEASRQKTTASKNSHSEAERRRRKRINGHLNTLRTMVPNTIKTDKASLLTEVVRHLRELKTTIAQDTNTFSIYPTETDQLQLLQDKTNLNLIIATLSCGDRPGLIDDMASVVRVASGKVVRAEMVTVGGRTKVVLWTQCGCEEGMEKLRRGLKVVVSVTGMGQVFPDLKRTRHSHDI